MNKIISSKSAKVAAVAMGLVAGFAMIAQTASAYTFSTNLKVGSTGVDVKNLQMVLNMNADTKVDGTGAGSAGKETSYFGPATKSAVIRFQEKYASDILAPLGLTAGTGFVGASTRAHLNTTTGGSVSVTGMVPGCSSLVGFSGTTGQSCATGSTTSTVSGCTSMVGFSPTTGLKCDASSTTTTTQSGPISVSLANDNPAASAVVAGQAIADLAHFTFTGNGTITNMKLMRTGISSNSVLSNVYLYNGNVRVSDGASVNNTDSTIVFNNLNLAVNGSLTLSVRSDIATLTAGQIVGVQLVGYTTSGSTSMTSASISGNYMSIAYAALSNVSVQANTVANGNVNAGNVGYTFWSAPVTVSVRSAALTGAMFKFIGSAPTSALANIKLYVDGTAVGTAGTLTSSGDLSFDFGSTPVVLNTGVSTIDVRADVVGGSSRTVSLSLQNAADLMVKDTQLNVNVAVVGPLTSSTSFATNTSGVTTINPGTLTVNQDPTFGNTTSLIGGATGVTMAAYKFTAWGEDVKVNTLTFTPTITSNSTAATVTGTVSAVVAGTAGLISTVTGAAVTGTTSLVGGTGYTSAPAVTITAPGVVSITSTTGTTASSTPATAATIAFTGGSCTTEPTATAVVASGLISSVTLLTPGVGCATVPTGTFSWTGGAPTTLPVITPTLGTQAVATATVASGAVSAITVTTAGTGYGAAPTVTIAAPASFTANLVNVGLFVNGAQVGSSQTASTSVALVFSNLGSNLIIPAGSSALVEIRGDVVNSTGANLVSGTVKFDLAAGSSNAQGVTSSTLVSTSAVGGQSLTVGSGTVAFAQTAGWAATTVAPNKQAVKIGTFTLQAGSNEAITVSNILVGITGTALAANQVSNLTVKDGTSGVGSPVPTPTATNNFSASISIPATTPKTFDVYADIGSAAAGLTVIPTMKITYRGSTSHLTTVSGAIAGATVTSAVPTVVAGGITFVPSSSLIGQYEVAGTSGIILGTFNAVSSNSIGGAVINDVTVTVSAANTIASVTINGKSASFGTGVTVATVYGVNITVPAGTSGVNIPMTVSLVCVNAAGGCSGTSNTGFTATISSLTYSDGLTLNTLTGITAATPTHTLAATKPEIAMAGTATTGLTIGSQQIGTFTVSANAGGDIKLQTIPVVTAVGGSTVTITASTVEIRDSAGNPITGTNLLSVGAGTFTFTTPRLISASGSETYTVWATTGGSLGTVGTSNVTFTLGAKGSFTWTDVKAAATGLTGTPMSAYPTTTQSKSN